jgi:hypothetical protein
MVKAMKKRFRSLNKGKKDAETLAAWLNAAHELARNLGTATKPVPVKLSSEVHYFVGINRRGQLFCDNTFSALSASPASTVPGEAASIVPDHPMEAALRLGKLLPERVKLCRGCEQRFFAVSRTTKRTLCRRCEQRRYYKAKKAKEPKYYARAMQKSRDEARDAKQRWEEQMRREGRTLPRRNGNSKPQPRRKRDVRL